MSHKSILTAGALHLGAAIMAVTALWAGPAAAPAHASAFIATLPGNDCAGFFGANFEACVVPASADPQGRIPEDTPVIIKFDFNDAGTISLVSINPLFPTIDGTEFVIVNNGDGTGTWTYLPDDPEDPAITAFVAKGGPDFNLFASEGDTLLVPWFTPINPMTGMNFGVSHLTFYDTGDGDGGGGGNGEVPEPATLALLGVAVLGLGLARRRRTRRD